MTNVRNNIKKIYIVRLGCDKNDVDADIMTGLLKKNHFTITNVVEDADIIVVNTCGFINSAKQESIDYILDAIELKKEGLCQKIIVTGCLAQRYASELAQELEEVDAFVGVGSLDEIVDVIESLEHNDNKCIWQSKPKISEKFSDRSVEAGTLSAFVKIAEGCNSFCSYCAIPMIRGRYQSREISDIVDEVAYLAKQGVKEIILVAQNTTAYGIDLYHKPILVDLLKELLKIKSIRWFRLLYCYPGNINDELLNLIGKENRIASYLDIPIQHSHPEILKLMNRKSIEKINVKWFEKLRNIIPDLTIRTTVMVGFPGETNEEFSHLLNFINEVKFDHLGVFCFSPEEGTIAFNMENQVSSDIAVERANIINEEQQIIAYKRKQRFLDKKVSIMLIEQQDNNLWLGRGQSDAPEIDGICYVSEVFNANAGDIVEVLITDIDFESYKGRMLKIEKLT